MKLFNDALFDDTPIVEPKVFKEVADPDKFVGKHPYFGEMYSIDDLKALLALDPRNEEVVTDVYMAIYAMRYRYPLLYSKGKLGSGLQDQLMKSKIEGSRKRITIMEKLWIERVEQMDEYLHKTYSSNSTSKNEGTSNSTSNSTGKSHNESTSNSESTGTSKNDGTTTSESNGTTTGETTSKNDTTGNSHAETSNTGSGTTTSEGTTTGHGSTTGTSKSTTDSSSDSKTAGINQNMPESNGLTGMYDPGVGINPGTLGTDYISDAQESSNKSSSKASTNGSTSGTSDSNSKSNTSGTTSNKSNGTTDGTSETHSTGSVTSSNISKNTGTGTSTSTGNTTGTATGSATSDGTSSSDIINAGNTTSNGENNSFGRNQDLITLSDKFQTLAARQQLANLLISILKPCMQINVITMDFSPFTCYEDPFGE